MQTERPRKAKSFINNAVKSYMQYNLTKKIKYMHLKFTYVA